MRVGFIGLGMMGTPMALNLARRFPLTVWNRSSRPSHAPLREAGAKVASSPAGVVRESDVIFTMLFNAAALQSVMDAEFHAALRGKTLVNTGSVSADFSAQLARAVAEAGGDFLEMPVSGSKVPAEQGKLVGMMAGDRAVADRVRPLVEPLTAAAVYCGPVGSGLKMKFAINLYLVSITAGLAESVKLARAQGLDLEAFGQVLDAGPLASPYSRVKMPKILAQDWSPQASIEDCYNSTLLIRQAGEEADSRSPLTQTLVSLYQQAVESGLGQEDMIAIAKLPPQP
ncbi:putative NAD binding NADP oxidoreductase coenzyme F420-dependent [Xylaria cf. heliscus]|nr:putative NAD binding NADP oxidoreductase coenzyme F420-dependent [Xylaria cf. heliscus]